MGRGRDGEGEGGLEIGLFEVGVHAACIGNLELGVEVYLVVDGVDHAVQAFARVHVGAVRADGDDVFADLEGRQLDASAVEALRGVVESLPVEGDLEGFTFLGRVHVNGGFGEECLGALREVESHVVVRGLEERGAFLCLGAREIFGGHSRSLLGLRVRFVRGSLPSSHSSAGVRGGVGRAEGRASRACPGGRVAAGVRHLPVFATMKFRKVGCDQGFFYCAPW